MFNTAESELKQPLHAFDHGASEYRDAGFGEWVNPISYWKDVFSKKEVTPAASSVPKISSADSTALITQATGSNAPSVANTVATMNNPAGTTSLGVTNVPIDAESLMLTPTQSKSKGILLIGGALALFAVAYLVMNSKD
jgi:hypothetical protein